MADYFGFNPPFIGGGVQNVMSRQEGDRLIKNDILQLLLTVPGERVMRPGFGVNLRNFVFENADINDLSFLETTISEQLSNQEPRVNVENVSITPDVDNNKISIKLIVTLKKDPKRQLVIEQFINTGVSRNDFGTRRI